jgi:hypothetical protein
MSTNAWAKPIKIEPQLPPVVVEHVGFRNEKVNMNNLPASIEINGTVWTRTTSASANGTYSYGSNGGTSSDIATNAHYTVSPYASSSKIYNVHYTVPGGGGPTRYYYYWDEPKDRRFQPQPIPDAAGKQLKYLVDKLLFEWTWFYSSKSAFGPATQGQVA